MRGADAGGDMMSCENVASIGVRGYGCARRNRISAKGQDAFHIELFEPRSRLPSR